MPTRSLCHSHTAESRCTPSGLPVSLMSLRRTLKGALTSNESQDLVVTFLLSGSGTHATTAMSVKRLTPTFSCNNCPALSIKVAASAPQAHPVSDYVEKRPEFTMASCQVSTIATPFRRLHSEIPPPYPTYGRGFYFDMTRYPCTDFYSTSGHVNTKAKGGASSRVNSTRP